MSTEATTPAPAPQAAGLSTTQRHSIRDGVCHATMLGFGENFLVPFGIFLHASFLQIGFLSTLPQLLAALGQTAGVWFIEHFRDRRRALARAVKVNAAIWIPIGLVALFSVQWNSAVYALLVLSAVYFASGGFIAPIWTSLIGD
ncbi:MAG: hypothetical protein IT290_12380, partial [Deltaproteobacteria bacterium]|nr:hypothetical protein [Deltaproteobacteria bacterium]